MPKFIAKVTLAVLIAGVRTEILPGEEVPELSEHDAKELKASGAIEDTAETAAQEKADARLDAKAAAAFEAERKAVQAAAASIAVPAKAGGKKQHPSTQPI